MATAGHFKELFSMEYAATSSRYISFIEHSSAAYAYKVSRQPCLLYETIKPIWYGALGLLESGIDYGRGLCTRDGAGGGLVPLPRHHPRWRFWTVLARDATTD